MRKVKAGALASAEMYLQSDRFAFWYNPAIDYSSLQYVAIGEMDNICTYCHALKFDNETDGMYCASGKIRLPWLEAPPDPLKTLLAGYTAEPKQFLFKIRKYNSCFQLTSFGAHIVSAHFMLNFKIRRQIYHKAGSLLPL
ncbi:hypothetical protein ENBRE01_3134 [Enteropsectra breve]|nr:hypothetical protein ENBRE01_3134 [Enteropsectra breve]